MWYKYVYVCYFTLHTKRTAYPVAPLEVLKILLGRFVLGISGCNCVVVRFENAGWFFSLQGQRLIQHPSWLGVRPLSPLLPSFLQSWQTTTFHQHAALPHYRINHRQGTMSKGNANTWKWNENKKGIISKILWIKLINTRLCLHYHVLAQIKWWKMKK